MHQKKNLANLFLILIFLVGIGILLYPNISDYINRKNSSNAVVKYNKELEKINKEKGQEILSAAELYNRELMSNGARFRKMTEEDYQRYMSLLNIDGNGMMGYISIDRLKINVPIFHTTEESVLQKYIGHVEGTSLPIGGKGCHAAVSGHRGLPSAVLFTNLDQMEIGDLFFIQVLGEKHIYKVDQIKTVLPDDNSFLTIEPEKDYVTLITCTPYGVNTHRLLVRGARVPDEDVEALSEKITPRKITREEIVNLIAVTMGSAFGILLLVPFFVKSKNEPNSLRPWDETILNVFDASIIISELATRENWEVSDVVKSADQFAVLRRWDEEGSQEIEHDSAEEESRDWDEEPEESKQKDWDEDILEKVNDDWSLVNEKLYRDVLKYSVLGEEREEIRNEETSDIIKDSE